VLGKDEFRSLDLQYCFKWIFFPANEGQFNFRVPDREDNFIEHQSDQVESVRIMTIGQIK
jgi:hypothetical protein